MSNLGQKSSPSGAGIEPWTSITGVQGVNHYTTTPPKKMVVEGKQAERLIPFLEDWLKEDMVGELALPDIPPWFSHLFTIPKEGNKCRPIIDRSRLNKRLKKIKSG